MRQQARAEDHTLSSAAQNQDEMPGQTTAAGQRARWLPVALIGVGLSALNAAWMTFMEIAWNRGYSTILSLYYNAVFTLVLVLLGNAMVRRVRPTVALNRAEMLILFVMTTMATAVAVNVEYLMSAVTHPYYYARPDNEWQEKLIPNLPASLTVSDPQAIKSYYLGNASLWSGGALRPWFLPFLGWGVFTMAVAWTGICLSILVDNQWRHQEKMPFPLVQIPLMLTEPKAAFTRNRLFWIGFALAAGINLLNTFHMIYPSVPELRVKNQFYHITGLNRPWTALDPIIYSFNPMLLGLEYFLPLDFLFSVVFFYWAGRMQGVFLSARGSEVAWDPAAMVAPFVREQAVGALLALLLFSFWTARGRWKESWERFPMVWRWHRAAWGAAGGSAVMIAFLCFAGMSVLLATSFVLLFLAVTLAFMRIRAQYGPPAAGLFEAAPGATLYALAGKEALGAKGLSVMALMSWLGSEYSDDTPPATLESFALAERRFPVRGLLACILMSALAGYVAAFGTALATGYTLGHGTARTAGVLTFIGNVWYNLFTAQLNSPVHGAHWDSIGALSLGGGATLLLQSLRTRFVTFPLHPVGYAVASTYISSFLWSTCLCVWLFKLFLLRYAGLKGYYAAAPFFLGLLLGEIIVGSLISIVGVAMGAEVYVFWPY